MNLHIHRCLRDGTQARGRLPEVIQLGLIVGLTTGLGGCLPSPSAPLGVRKSATENPPTNAKPVSEPVSEPVFRPLIAENASESANSSAAHRGGVATMVDARRNRLELPKLTSPPPVTFDPAESSATTGVGRVNQLASQPSQDERVDAATSPVPRGPAAQEYVPANASPAKPVIAIPESKSRAAVPLKTEEAADDTPFTPPAPPSADPLAGNPLPLRMRAPLVSRRKFFRTAQRSQPRVSPDGTTLAYLAPLQGVLNVFVAPVDEPDRAQPVTTEAPLGISDFFWAFTSRHVIYLQDRQGDAAYHVYCVSLDTGKTTDLTPIDNISARVLAVSDKFPAEIVVGINDRSPHEWHDVHRINIVTGAHRLMLKNPGFATFHIDDDYKIRFGQSHRSHGGQRLAVADPNAPDGWTDFLSVDPEDSLLTGFVSFDKLGTSAYMLDSRGRDTAALILLDLATRETKVLAENPLADISGTLIHPTTKNVQAATCTYDRRKWQIIDPALDRDMEYLHSVDEGDISVTSRSLDDSLWTVEFRSDRSSPRYYLYRRDPQATKILFSGDPELETLPLVRMHPVTISSRDGLQLVSYLSLPVDADPNGDGRPESPLPLVLEVHGGPWARDHWEYDPVHQWLANRGYAVMSVNFRGSTGFGKRFLNAGDGEWAGKMQDDLLDAVEWAIQQRIAQPDRIAIMGGGFGGYAALVGLTFSPDVFACGIDIAGPADLVSLLETPPPYWLPMMKNRVGDHETAQGREFLLSRSPIGSANRISRPLLIAHGALDPVVQRQNVEQLVSTMRGAGVPVTYLLYPQEGHGFRRPENRFAFYAVAEAFLAEHLGGRYEPIGDDFRDATFKVPAGREYVPGLRERDSSMAGPSGS